MCSILEIMHGISISDGFWLVVGFCLGLIPQYYERSRQKKNCKHSLLAEIKYCAQTAKDYLCSGVQAPAYRLPTAAWENAYPVLIGAGKLTENQVDALLKYYSGIETFNRCLDQIDAAQGDQLKFDQEVKRLKLKAENISIGKDLYKSTIEALKKYN